MKSKNPAYLTAAALAAALSAPAMAQTPGVNSQNQNQGSGATSTDPSNETYRNNASGARVEGDTRYGTRSDIDANVNGSNANGTVTPPVTNTDSNSGLNTVSGTAVDADGNPIHETSPAASSTDDMKPAKKKRTFWDKVFGRNKHLDSRDHTDATPTTP